MESYCIIKVDKNILIHSILVIFIMWCNKKLYYDFFFFNALLLRYGDTYHFYFIIQLIYTLSFWLLWVSIQLSIWIYLLYFAINIWKTIEYSKSIINVYSPSLKWIVGRTINLINGTHNYVRWENTYLWYSESTQ